jgi:hypothetical protein
MQKSMVEPPAHPRGKKTANAEGKAVKTKAGKSVLRQWQQTDEGA